MTLVLNRVLAPGTGAVPAVAPHDIIRLHLPLRGGGWECLEACVLLTRDGASGSDGRVVFLWDGEPLCVEVRWDGEDWTFADAPACRAGAADCPPCPLGPFLDTLRLGMAEAPTKKSPRGEALNTLSVVRGRSHPGR